MDVLRIRESLGLTQAEFADMIGVSRPYVARLETGRQEPAKPLQLLLQAISDGWRPRPHARTDRRTKAPQRVS